MSLAAFPIAAVAIAEVVESSRAKAPPKSRVIVAKPDRHATAEPR